MNRSVGEFAPQARGTRSAARTLGVLGYALESVGCGIVGWFGTLMGAGVLSYLSTGVAIAACATLSVVAVGALIALLIRRKRLPGFVLGIPVGVTLASTFVIFVLIPFAESMSNF
ncbi:hypothetical protein [Gordonia sp. CPCC 205333]|uniref:hypothetical protein n=1 Tax=Gordonia sp. CPCC 205333 TaxID=3140790 RepID=UPI003AF35B16